VSHPPVSATRTGPIHWPKAVRIPVLIAVILAFVLLGFPWDSLARRIAWEFSEASGGSVSIETLAPALTARGPVLRARDVIIEHRAVDRVRLTELEIAPRPSFSWFSGEPTLRVWADSELGLIDGVLAVGEDSTFVGQISRVELARLPLRLAASGVQLTGEVDADANVTLDPRGTLGGRVAFSSPSLVIRSNQLPMAIPFTHTEGVVVILENGATQIESATFEGELIEGELSGEIGLAHRSQAPPIDFKADFRIVNPILRQLAPGAGLSLTADGEISVRVRGPLDAPVFESQAAPNPRARNRPQRSQR
jgi:type II secretion system protein N